MAAAVSDRLQTESGELIKHPEYGINMPGLVGEPGDLNAMEFTKIELQRTLLQDPRIKKVSNLVVKKTDQALSADMNLTLIDEKTRVMSTRVPTV